MNIQNASPRDEIALSPNWSTLADMLGGAWAMWQFPLMTALGWWGEAINAHWSSLSHATASTAHPHEHHNELIVPDILEEDDEHALFA